MNVWSAWHLPKQAAQDTSCRSKLRKALMGYSRPSLPFLSMLSLSPDQHSRPPACLGRAACLGPEARRFFLCALGPLAGDSTINDFTARIRVCLRDV